jgi:hypothetical protein
MLMTAHDNSIEQVGICSFSRFTLNSEMTIMPAPSIAPAFSFQAPFAETSATRTLELDLRSDPGADASFHTLLPAPLADLAHKVRALRSTAIRSGSDVTFSLALRPVVSGKGNGLLERFGLHRGRASLQLHQDAVGLVGTPGEIADAVLDHYDIGIDHFVLHGSDAAGLIPLIRRKVARRKAELNILAG